MLFYDTITPGALDLLKKIQSEPFWSALRLVGGTALALQLGHRKSIDLDFFGSFATDALQIKELLAKIGPYQVMQESKFIFQYIVKGVKVDFVCYPYGWIAKAVEKDGLLLAGPKDIAAMKIAAITNRGTKKDFIDLYELLNHSTLEQMLAFYREKYSDAISFTAIKSLTWFADAEEEPMPFMLKDYSWQAVKEKITTSVCNLG